MTEGLPAPYRTYSWLTMVSAIGWATAVWISPSFPLACITIGIAFLAATARRHRMVPDTPFILSGAMVVGGFFASLAATSWQEAAAKGVGWAGYCLALIPWHSIRD